MSKLLGSTQFDTYARYELRYDLLSQSIANNNSKVRLYGVLVVTGNHISWSRGSASVHTSGLQTIGNSYSKGTYTVIQRDFTFGHDNNGNFSAYIGASISTTYKSGNTGGTLKLPKINRYPVLNSGSDFTDETNPTLNFTSYNTFPIRVKLEAGGNTQLIIRDIPANSTKYTFDLTEEERQKLRALTLNNNSLTVTETVCAMNGNKELSASYKQYKMTIVNGNPTFNNFEFEDINSKTVALTGNNQSIISGYSNIKATISETNKAIAIKEAAMSKYRLSAGENKIVDFSYVSTGLTSGTLNAVTSSSVNVYAIDSRNNSTLVSKQAANFYSYNKLIKGNISLERSNGGTGENVTLTYNGTIDLKNFGKVTNSIKSATYTLQRADSSEVIKGTGNIIPNVSSNSSFNFTGLIKGDTEELGFDIGSSYLITVTIEDELSSITYTATLSSGTPNIALAKNGVGIMGKYDESVGGLLQVGGKRIGEEIYSTEEVKTNKIWIDGKPIYRRIFSFTTLVNINTGISSIDNIVKMECLIHRQLEGGQWRNLPWLYNKNMDSSWAGSFFYREDNDLIFFQVGETLSNIDKGFLILEYTKTTDS